MWYISNHMLRVWDDPEGHEPVQGGTFDLFSTEPWVDYFADEWRERGVGDWERSETFCASWHGVDTLIIGDEGLPKEGAAVISEIAKRGALLGPLDYLG